MEQKSKTRSWKDENSNSLKETLIDDLGITPQIDPLFYGKVNMDPSEKAQLHSGDKVCHFLMQKKTNYESHLSFL